MTTNMFGLDDSLTARDERVARDAWHKAQNLYDGVVGMQALGARVGGRPSCLKVHRRTS